MVAKGSVATVLIGVIMVFNLQSYAWTGFGLAVLAILVIAGAYILRQTQLL